MTKLALNIQVQVQVQYAKLVHLKINVFLLKHHINNYYRWEHEEIIEQHIEKMKTTESKAIVKKRGSIVEHPFGTIKRNLGWDHFLVRGKEKVSGENALIMFSYNFKRLLNLIGIALFQKLMIAIKDGDIEKIREEIVQYIAISLLYILCFFQNTFMFKFSSKKCIILR